MLMNIEVILGTGIYIENTICYCPPAIANSAIFRSWIFIVLAHWNNSLWIDILTHSVTLSWFRVNQSLIFLLNNVYMSEESTTTKVTYDCIPLPWYCTVLVYVVIHICENECSLLSESISVMEYYYLAFQPFDLEPWRLYLKRVVRTTLDIYVF
jgi:hypothetical protein